MTRRLAHYVFLDVEKFTQLGRNADDQVMIVDALGKIVKESLASLEIQVDEKDRSLLLPTGDGVCICLLGEGAFDEHIQVALLVLKKLKAHNGRQRRLELKFQVRIGINTHTDVHVRDIRGNWNMAGRGISDAQRTMDAGDGGNLIVSEIVYKTLIDSHDYLKPYISFRHLEVQDKHGEMRSVYQYNNSKAHGLNNDEPRTRKSKSDLGLRNAEALFWLGHDLRWTRAQLGEGGSKERVLKGLKQMLVHYTSSKLSVEGVQERLTALLRSTEQVADPKWNDDVRGQLIEEVDGLIDEIARWLTQQAVSSDQESTASTTQENEQIAPSEHRGWIMHQDPTMSSDILAEPRGTLSVWARVTDEHHKLQSRRPLNQYIVSHAANRGLNYGNSEYARYPNAWAIRRITPCMEAKAGAWSFWCNAMEPPKLEINNPAKLAAGWHLFTVEWSADKNFVRFYIDDELAGQDEFRLWPKGLTGSMVLGTWVHDYPNHRFNSEVGPCYTIPRTMKEGELAKMLAARPA